jgi:hypothetical protein
MGSTSDIRAFRMATLEDARDRFRFIAAYRIRTGHQGQAARPQ